MTTQQIQTTLENNSIFADRLYKSKGKFVFKRSYFYTHGEDAQTWADKIKGVIPTATIINAFNDFQRWPKTSYFVVEFTL